MSNCPWFSNFRWKITKLRLLKSFSLQNVQRVHIIQYKFWLISWILQHVVFITNKNYIYVAIWTILNTFYHAKCMFLENGLGNNS